MRKTVIALCVLFIAVMLINITSAQSLYPVATRNSHAMPTPHPYLQPTPRPVCIITQTYYNCGGSIHGSSETQLEPIGELPETVSIYIPASEGMYKLEVQDAFGNWSLVTDTEHPEGIVFQSRDGFVELIGNTDQPTDPANYRLIEYLS